MADTNAKTILIVDDDYELSDGIRAMLEREGHRVLQARDGQQGKNLIYQQHPDLVILDMMMPRMGGFPVLEFLKGLKDAPPVIMITANEGGRHKAYAEMLGVSAYLRKPFAMDVLLEAVADALDAVEVARRIVAELRNPVALGEHEVFSKASTASCSGAATGPRTCCAGRT